VAETPQLLGKKVNWHKNDIQSQSTHTVMASHYSNTGHGFHFDNVSGVRPENSVEKRKILEVLHISRLEPLILRLIHL